MVNNFKCLHRHHYSVDGEWFLHVDSHMFDSKCCTLEILLICIWCYFIIQWNKWVKYYCIWQCVYKIPLNSYKSTWAKGSSTIVIMCFLSSVRDYFKHYWLFRNCWTEFNEIWQEFKQSSTKFVFLGWLENQERCPGLWLAKTFLTSLKLLNRIQRNLTGSKLSTSTTKFVFWGHWKPRWPLWPLIGRDLFCFFSATTELNSTILDRNKI